MEDQAIASKEVKDKVSLLLGKKSSSLFVCFCRVLYAKRDGNWIDDNLMGFLAVTITRGLVQGFPIYSALLFDYNTFNVTLAFEFSDNMEMPQKYGKRCFVIPHHRKSFCFLFTNSEDSLIFEIGMKGIVNTLKRSSAVEEVKVVEPKKKKRLSWFSFLQKSEKEEPQDITISHVQTFQKMDKNDSSGVSILDSIASSSSLSQFNLSTTRAIDDFFVTEEGAVVSSGSSENISDDCEITMESVVGDPIAVRKEEEEMTRKKEEMARKKEEEEMARKKEEEEMTRKKEEEEMTRKKEEEEIARKKEKEEIARKKEEKEIARKKEEKEIARKKEEEIARKKEEEMSQKKMEIARKKEEEKNEVIQRDDIDLNNTNISQVIQSSTISLDMDAMPDVPKEVCDLVQPMSPSQSTAIYKSSSVSQSRLETIPTSQTKKKLGRQRQSHAFVGQPIDETAFPPSDSVSTSLGSDSQRQSLTLVLETDASGRPASPDKQQSMRPQSFSFTLDSADITGDMRSTSVTGTPSSPQRPLPTYVTPSHSSSSERVASSPQRTVASSSDRVASSPQRTVASTSDKVESSFIQGRKSTKPVTPSSPLYSSTPSQAITSYTSDVAIPNYSKQPIPAPPTNSPPPAPIYKVRPSRRPAIVCPTTVQPTTITAPPMAITSPRLPIKSWRDQLKEGMTSMNRVNAAEPLMGTFPIDPMKDNIDDESDDLTQSIHHVKNYETTSANELTATMSQSVPIYGNQATNAINEDDEFDKKNISPKVRSTRPPENPKFYIPSVSFAKVKKTVTCSFSEYKIYPGHGGMYIRKDGQPVRYLNSKCCSLNEQKKKPARIRWTSAWRRNNKKAEAAEKSKRRSKKSFKVQRAVAGMTVSDIQKKREQKNDITKKSKEAALAEIKNRKSKKPAHK